MPRTPEQVETELLVLDAQSGDREALAGLVRLWHGRFYRHARLLSDDDAAASDALQEAWTAIIKGVRSLRDPADFPAWALRIVGHKCADAVRGNRRRRALSAEQAPSATAARSGVPSSTDEHDELRRAIDALPQALRETVSLFYGCGLGIEQTARALALPEGTVKSRLSEARTRLRQAIERNDHERV